MTVDRFLPETAKLIRDAHKATAKQGRIAASQRRKRRGTEASLVRALDLIRRALDEDQDGYRLAPDLEVEMRGALNHQEALERKHAIDPSLTEGDFNV